MRGVLQTASSVVSDPDVFFLNRKMNGRLH